MRYSERATQPEPTFFSVDFSVVTIYRYFLFVNMQKIKNKKTYIAFTCVNPLLSLFSFIIFILLLPFSMNFKSNFGLNLNTINLFHLNCKISFGFLPVKEKSLGLLELASEM